MSGHRDMIRIAECSLQVCTEGGQKMRHEFRGEVLNFGYHLGLDILDTEVRLKLGLNDHRAVFYLRLNRKTKSRKSSPFIQGWV